MFEHIQVEQCTDEWFAARLGKITGSSFGKYITPLGKASSSAATLNKKLIEEKVTGRQSEYFQTEHMERGNELEPHALAWFNKELGREFEPVGFFDSGKGWGVSPDAIDFTLNEGVEIKCPLLSTHLDYIAKGVIPSQYVAQVQGQLMVSGFDHWYFVSYSPQVNTQLVLKIERDETYINKLRSILEKNIPIINETAAKLIDLGVKAV
jgi:putative phage-type endonuclease